MRNVPPMSLKCYVLANSSNRPTSAWDTPGGQFRAWCVPHCAKNSTKGAVGHFLFTPEKHTTIYIFHMSSTTCLDNAAELLLWQRAWRAPQQLISFARFPLSLRHNGPVTGGGGHRMDVSNPFEAPIARHLPRLGCGSVEGRSRVMLYAR